ncbi:MAG: LamG-like jellyroll fold domain-containing protein [Candidatus Kapaibacterium sp.]
MNSLRISKRRIFCSLLLTGLVTLLCITDAFAQSYRATLNQRRRGDQIYVEVWIKALTANAPKLGESSLVIQYNAAQLTPAATQAPSTTDTVQYDVDVANPVQTITSQFDAANGYQSLANQSYGAGLYSLEVRKVFGSTAGIVPSTSGLGSFVGRMIFDINTTGLTDATLSQVKWSTSTLPGDIVIFDFNENNIESQVSFVDPSDFTIIGITILNPNGPSEVVDRDKVYASVASGYPIYFERSGIVAANGYGVAGAAYVFDYSLNGGSSWTEFGRAAEDGSTVNGDIHASAVTAFDGTAAAADGRQIVRVRWAANANFAARSEEARLRITQLATAGAIAGRARQTRLDMSDANFALGRLFFSQLNGTNTYLKSTGAFSNSTQLTVSAWVNLNEYKPTGSTVGVVASSGGPTAGSEGAWMLYLKDGKYPAFRAREILGRGTNGYIADIVSPITLNTASDAIPLGQSHADNWVHLAATVANNVVTLYVNGEIVDQVTNDLATNIRMQTTNHPIWVGVNPNISIDANNYLHAGVKGVQIWRTALTQTQIRTRIPGVVTPSTVGAVPADPTFINRSLEIYYTLEGTRTDAASDATYQLGDQAGQYYVDNAIANSSIRFRPDRPHIKLTSPIGCEGVSNLTGIDYKVRWVGYGIGDITATGADLDIQFSTDGGSAWTYARNAGGNAATNDLGPGATAAVDIEAGEATWRPYNNDNTFTNGGTVDLRSIASAYAKNTILRIRGHVAAENEISSTSESFIVAPYFSLHNQTGNKLEIAGGTSLNAVGQTFMVEAWIRPYRFPTPSEYSFPIIAKVDTSTFKPHYALNLLSTGQLQLQITDNIGNIRTAVSDAANANLVVKPNSVSLDSAWTHVAAWVNIGNGTGASEVRFYIDGTPQRADSITTQLGSGITLNSTNTYPAYIGYQPISTSGSRSFEGELRDIRFWNGTPAGAATTGNEPTALTTHIQGALTATGSTLTGGSATNLQVAFDLNGGAINTAGYQNSIVSQVGNVRANIAGTPICYYSIRPYLKMVEPVFNQRVRNTTTNMSVRWVGYNYNGGATGFSGGVNAGATPSLEYSIRGGGGVVVQPYQYVGSDYWDVAYTDATAFPAGSNFTGSTAGNMRFGCTLDLSLTDPDLNDNGTYTDQGALSATLSNARLRLWNSVTINTTALTISTEGPIFTITPPSNFTLRLLLEGLNEGLDGVGAVWHNLSTTYAGGGIRIKLYRNNSGSPGPLVAQAESEFQYDANAFSASAITNKGTNTGDGPLFANVPFVFTDLPDGSYWVVVESPNHLPIMSKSPATFLYSGDLLTTSTLESGWDFSTWTGADDHASYSAYGSAKSTTSNTAYSTTGLIFNEGRDGITGTAANYIAGMVAGDCEKDGQINAADRVRVRADAGTALVRSDVDGDGSVGAVDRTLVDRNFGKVSSIYNVTFPGSSLNDDGMSGKVAQNDGNPFEAISNEDPAMSKFFNDEGLKFIENGASAVTSKKGTSLQGSKNYKFTIIAEPVKVQNFVDVPVYINNTGDVFNMGNATYSVQFNPKRLKFVSLTGTDKVAYSNKLDKGYNAMYSAPKNNADLAIEGVRTIEIDYDAFSRKGGEPVSAGKSYVGTLRFELLDNAGSVSFKWYKNTGVISAQNEFLSSFATLEDIKPIMMYSASIVKPAVGEKLVMNKSYPITWTSTGSSTVFAEYSVDGGNTWVRINTTAMPTTALQVSFTTPSNAATDCYVRLVDEETGAEVSRSKKFEIVNISASITRPAATDPVYVGGVNDIIRWGSVGLAKVHFEFSPNGLDTWSPVATVVNATNGSVSWKVPTGVNSKRAVVRLIDEETQTEINRTAPFKILSGSVSLLNPSKGEVVKPAQSQKLRWRTVNDVKTIELQLSVDGGSTWSTLGSNVNGTKLAYDWTVPSIATKQAVIRAIYPEEAELEYARTPMFSIDGPVEVVDITDGDNTFSNVAPNPTSGYTAATFTLSNAQPVSVVVYNNVGEIVSRYMDNVIYEAGTHTMEVSLNGLPSGTYYIQFNAGLHKETKKVVVFK